MRPIVRAAFALSLTACGAAPRPAPQAPVEAAPPPPVVAHQSVIRRAALDAVLEGGLGRFLQTVETAADVRDGHFVGFRLTALHDEALFEGIDLLPGDTLVAVNGQGIERPEDAYTAWTSLRVASELDLVILRGEERRALRFAIID